jgi:hypothetical protein
VVLTGMRASLDALGRLVYAARRSESGVAVYDFRGAVPDTGASAVPRLGESPTGACETLLAALEEPAVHVAAPARASG